MKGKSTMTTADKPRVLAIELPEGERGISPDQIARFDKAQRALANPMTKPRAREEHLRTLARIEHGRKEAAERSRVDQGTDETITLAELRGEEVERQKSGAARIRSRDGLQNLYVNRQLTQEQYDHAMAWRGCFEARSSDVGSQMGGLGGGSAHDNDKFVKVRLTRAQKTNLLAVAQRRIAVECLSEPAALQMFNEIIGNCKCLTSFGRGRAYDRHLSALGRALHWAEEARKEVLTRERSGRAVRS